MVFGKKNKYIPSKSLIKEYNQIRLEKANNKFCHAPFHTLVFLTYGKIQACFYNKRESLGIYPNETIRDVWFGDKIKILRKNINKNNLQYGCDDCLRQIQQKNFYSVGAWRYDYLCTEEKKYPTSFEFQISNNCNLQCIMCNGELSNQIRSEREGSTNYKTPYNDEFIEQLREFIPHLKQASFTGGETFLIPIYYKIWDLMAELNPNIEIYISTNGTILTEKVKSYLKKLRFNFSISIDAVDEKIYSEIRQGANLKQTLENFSYCIEYSKSINTSVNVKVCPLRNNIYHIPELINYFNRFDVPVILNNVYFPPYCTIWNLPSDKLDKIQNYLESKIEIGKSEEQKNNWNRYKNLINQISNWKEEAIIRERNNINNKIKSVDLIQQLKQNISEYFETVNYNTSAEKKDKQNKYIEIISNSFEHITDENKKIYTIQYFLDLPIERVVAEFEFRDLSKLINRITQISEND